MLSARIVLHLFASASRVQRKRAALTVAAIAWGTLTLLLLLAFGEGLSRQLLKARAGMGNNIAVLWPGETSKVWRGLPVGRPIRPTVDDLDLIRGRVPGLATALGELRSWQTALTYETKTVNGRVTGTSPGYGPVRNHIPQWGGRFINDTDIAQRRRVIFLGNEMAEQIFGTRSPVGEVLLVNNVPYVVIGVMKKKLQMGAYGGPDAQNAVVPITTLRAQWGRDRLSNILLVPERAELMDSVLREFKKALSAKYGFDPEDERVFGVWNTVESSKMFNNIVIGIQVFLAIIGGLTLLVGGVGVANIMYAVVNERTREIGVKMALGARSAWITGPLVLEALVFTLTGGVVGLLVAIGLVSLIGLAPTEGNEALEFLGKPVISPAIGIASAAILGVIGLAAGYFPARRAASINPAETLRYE
jgi:putative ABC transport system permease protein